MATPSTKIPQDILLASRCALGDRQSCGEVFHQQKNRVHATLYRVLGRNLDMEDLIQESFIEIFKSLESFRGEAQLSTWIDRITVRVAYGYLRRKKGKTARLEAIPEIPDHDPNAEQRLLLQEATRRLHQLLDSLDAKMRIAFTLHAIDERSLVEVADLMSATLVGTKTRVWRARRILAKRARHDSLLSNYLQDIQGK